MRKRKVEKRKKHSSYASICQIEEYIFQMESSISVHRHRAKHKAENHVSKVQGRGGGQRE